MNWLRVPVAVAALVALVTLCAIVPQPVSAQGIDLHYTRLLSQPAISQHHISFLDAGDLWIANRDGSGVRRLTPHDGTESSPQFSPDGSMLAFSAQYDGNVDVYVVRAEGGVPRRLTWHPMPDRVQGFTPDGAAVLFTSGRAVHTGRYQQFFTVPAAGGHPEQLPIPNGAQGTFSPDGAKIAYRPLYEAFTQWKNYRGGTVSRIWLYDRGDHSVEEIPQPSGRSNDTSPMWFGDRVYFRSDRNGEFNLFSYVPGSGAVEQLTHYDDFPILSASAGAGQVIYEQAGYLHVLDPASGESARLPVGVSADLIETRPRFSSGDQFIRAAGLSPSGVRAVFEFRGEIVTVPAEEGDPRNITQTTSVHERSPAWSPDGATIAYFSDASGEYQIHLAPQDGRGEVRSFEIDGAGFYFDIKWSPDGEWMSFTDNSLTLFVLVVSPGQICEGSTKPIDGHANLI